MLFECGEHRRFSSSEDLIFPATHHRTQSYLLEPILNPGIDLTRRVKPLRGTRLTSGYLAA